MPRLLILLTGVILLFFPFLIFSQSFPIQKGVTVTVEVPGIPTPPTPPTPPPPPSPGGAAPVPSPPAKVIFKGRAYPFALLTILKDKQVAATFKAFSSGLFEKELTGVSGGVYEFSIWAEDSEGRKSVTLSFTISVLAGRTTTISGIFISPTIALTPTQVERGARIALLGQSFPKSQVYVFISSNEIAKQTAADKKGKWSFKLDTSPLEEGEHEARARALYKDGEQSQFSQTLQFLVLRRGALICRGADLNFDGMVDLVDFSILLYFWGQSKPSNPCADINFDGIVDLVDFSIMMYWWTG